MIKKTVQRSEDYFIQFTEKELSQLNLKVGDRFDFKYNEDGTLTLVPWSKIDINLSDFSREVLEMLICLSIEEDKCVNDIICDIIKNTSKEVIANETSNTVQTS